MANRIKHIPRYRLGQKRYKNPLRLFHLDQTQNRAHRPPYPQKLFLAPLDDEAKPRGPKAYYRVGLTLNASLSLYRR